jgi:citrate synthase
MSEYKITYPGGELELPVREAAEGPSGLEIGKLMKDTGQVTLDTGFVNTASCTSAITYIDGDAGILRYRGYPIEQLAERSTFLESSYLLIHGELPSTAQLDEFTSRIQRHTLLHEEMRRFFDGFPRDAHPMAVLSSAVSALSTFYQDSLNPFDQEHVEISTIRLLAKVPTIASYAYKKAIGQPMLYPDNSLGYVENFLRMTFGVPATPYEIDPVAVKVLDMLFLLHADHEQNCSTSTVRLVGSSHANLFASVSAGVNALFGPLHGGANQAVLEMLQQIHAQGGDVDGFVRKVKNREDGVKLMGFGHRVYKNYDPRAAIVKKAAQDILGRMAKPDPLLDLAVKLEEIALADDFFVSRKLYPAMGFPTTMFTVLFALGRLPGWIAQWREMINDPETKIGRPRQVYIGETERDYPAVADR